MQLLCCSRVFMHRRAVSAPFQHCDEAITIYEPIILHRGVFLMALFVLCWKTYKLNTTYDEKDFLCKDPWSKHWSPNCFDKSVCEWNKSSFIMKNICNQVLLAGLLPSCCLSLVLIPQPLSPAGDEHLLHDGNDERGGVHSENVRHFG